MVLHCEEYIAAFDNRNVLIIRQEKFATLPNGIKLCFIATLPNVMKLFLLLCNCHNWQKLET